MKLAEQLYQVINVYYNFSGALKYNCFRSDCPSTATEALDGELGWAWQTCTAMPMIMCDMGGDTDFFINNCNVTGGLVNMTVQDCVKKFGHIGYVPELFHVDAVSVRYGFTYGAASNIIFT
ncbi:unnamed protein product [Gongylonema pulchrum]|uniref:Isoamyl alcohol oxidase n=1 Tax=Gongylonema pulchrum TaxID=637853 RepID=A0A183DGR6_9BILA|nr:unnamed protein product [Gongylonema pulchrum]